MYIITFMVGKYTTTIVCKTIVNFFFHKFDTAYLIHHQWTIYHV